MATAGPCDINNHFMWSLPGLVSEFDKDIFMLPIIIFTIYEFLEGKVLSMTSGQSDYNKPFFYTAGPLIIEMLMITSNSALI